MNKDNWLWRHKKWFFIFFLMMYALVIYTCFSDGGESAYDMDEEEADSGYVVNYFDTNVKVSRNSTLHVEEKLKVDFLKKRHGIYRNIDLRRSMASGDLQLYRISNVKVKGGPWSSYESDGLYELEIGDSEKLIKGSHEYVITYDLTAYRAAGKGSDNFFLSLTGKRWSSVIEKLNYQIEFEDARPSKAIQEDASRGGLEYKTENGKLTLTDTCENILPGEEAAVEFKIPENYFTVEHKFETNQNYLYIWILAASGVLLLLILLRFFYHRKCQSIKNVAIYPPEHIDSIQAGAAFDETILPRHVFSMLYWLLDHRLIGARFGKEKPDIDYVSLPAPGGALPFYLKELYQMLFRNQTTVRQGELTGRIIPKMEELLHISKKFFKGKNSLFITDALQTIILLVNAWIAYRACSDLGAEFFFELSMLSWLAGIYVMFWSFYRCFTSGSFGGILKQENKWNLLWAFGYLAIVWYVFKYSIAETWITLMAVLLPLMVVFLLPYCKMLSGRNRKIRMHMEGLAKFIQGVEPEQLERLINKDSQYYFHILPFACAIGLEEIWTEKAGAFLREVPVWVLEGYEYFSWDCWLKAMKRTQNYLMTALKQTASCNAKSVYGNIWDFVEDDYERDIGSHEGSGGSSSSGGGSW